MGNVKRAAGFTGQGDGAVNTLPFGEIRTTIGPDSQPILSLSLIFFNEAQNNLDVLGMNACKGPGDGGQ